MKTNTTSIQRSHSHALSTFLLGTLAVATILVFPQNVHAQVIYVANDGAQRVGVDAYDVPNGTVLFPGTVAVGDPQGIALSGTNLYVASAGGGIDPGIGVYNATTGAAVNTALVTTADLLADTGPGFVPAGIAVSGSNLYVVNTQKGGISVFNDSTGALVDASLVSGLVGPIGIAISGSNLFVVSSGSTASNGFIGEYDLATGAAINTSLVSGLAQPSTIALSGSNLYVTEVDNDLNHNLIGEYNATTGAVVNATLVSGLLATGTSAGIAVSGSDLFASNINSISEYDANTGALINPHVASGLAPFGIGVNSPSFIAVAAVPEPSTYAALLGFASLGFAGWRRRKHRQ